MALRTNNPEQRLGCLKANEAGRSRCLRLAVVWAMVIAGGWISTGQAQSKYPIIAKRRAVPVATVRDPQTVQFFVEQFLIPEATVDSIDVIDVVGDGFNDKDILQVYPSKQLYNLSESDTAMTVMRNWQRGGFITVVASKNNKGQFEARSNYPVAVSMFAGLTRLLESNYEGKQLTFLFDYNGVLNTAELMMWGHQEDDLTKTPDPTKQFAHDLMLYVRADTIEVAKPVYDVIVIQQTVTDTVLAKPTANK
jgi:hypothetical protein